MKQAVLIILPMCVCLIFGLEVFAQTDSFCSTERTSETSLVTINTFKSEWAKITPENYFRPKGFQENNGSFQLQNFGANRHFARNGFWIGIGTGLILENALKKGNTSGNITFSSTTLLCGITGFAIGSIQGKYKSSFQLQKLDGNRHLATKGLFIGMGTGLLIGNSLAKGNDLGYITFVCSTILGGLTGFVIGSYKDAAGSNKKINKSSFQLQKNAENRYYGRNGFLIGAGTGLLTGISIFEQGTDKNIAVVSTTILGGLTGLVVGSVVGAFKNYNQRYQE